jgi:uncharacterized RDD family membrane protein YckC
MPEDAGSEQATPPPPMPPPGYGFTPPPGSYPPPPPFVGDVYPSTTQAGPNQTSLADYGPRLGGWLIDWLILSAVGVPILFVTHGIHRTHSVTVTNGVRFHETGFGVGGYGFLIQGLVVVAYGTLLCGSARGQTIGMMASGCRVIDATHGGPIGHGRALGRAAFEYLMAIVVFIPWIVDMLFPLWDKHNQTLHDKVVGSVVVKL